MSAPSVSMSRVPTFMSVSTQLTDKRSATDGKHSKDEQTSGRHAVPGGAQIRLRSSCCSEDELYIKRNPAAQVSESAALRKAGAARKIQHLFLKDVTSELKVHKNRALAIFLAAGVTKEQILVGQYRALHRAYLVIEALETLGVSPKKAGEVVLAALQVKQDLKGLTGIDLKHIAAFLHAFTNTTGVTLTTARQRGALLQSLGRQLEAVTARELTRAVVRAYLSNDDVAIGRAVSILSVPGAAAGVGADRALTLARRYKDDFKSLENSLDPDRRVELLAQLGAMSDALPVASLEQVTALMARCPHMSAKDAVFAVTSPRFTPFQAKLSLENSAHLVLALAERGIDHGLILHPELQADIGHAITHMRHGDTADMACAKLPLLTTAKRIQSAAQARAQVETKSSERPFVQAKPTGEGRQQTVQVPRSNAASSRLGVPSTVPRPTKTRENKISESVS